MPKRLIKRFAPDHDSIRAHKHLQMFGNLLHDPNLWHMNRRSVSGAFAIGLFWGLIPMPFQMIAAAATAIPARVNLPISVALVWITNPLTIPPLFYFNYRVGVWILGAPPEGGHLHWDMESLMEVMEHIWQPLYLGSLVSALVASVTGYLIIRGFWRLHIVSNLKRRRLRRHQKAGDQR